jgi:hypothetical protein
MTKRLFVVLVVLTAMLISFSLVMAAKKEFTGVKEPFVKQTVAQQQADPMPRGELTATVSASSIWPDRPAKGTASTASVSSGVELQAAPFQHTKDFCDLYGVPAYAITDWIYGLEYYANYQNPEEFGCVNVWPFEVTQIQFNIQVDYAMDIDIQGFVYDADFTVPDCPVPSAELCATPIYTVSIPSGGHWILGLPMTEQCCVDGPYFAGVYIYTDLYGTGSDAVSEDDATDACRSYNDYGSGWEDLVVIYGWPGEILLSSTGYTSPQNTCEVPEEPCEMVHHNYSAQSYFSGWSIGDQNACYFDPATMCVDCAPVYPLNLIEVKGAFYDFAGAGTVDITVHVYDAGDICVGPGVELYSFDATVTTFYPDEASIPVPELMCIEDDFFLAVEYQSGATGTIPCLLFDNQQEMVDTCYQWNDYQDYGWIEWWDFWAPPIAGWLMMSAVGTCNEPLCNPGTECYMAQGSGAPSSYWSGWGANDGIAKYYDPELFCTPPVYPYRIDGVDVAMYDYPGAGSVDVEVVIYLECSEPCDGPGTEVYRSPVVTITDMYPSLAHVVLPDLVCMYEPFFVGIHYPNGVAGATPSVLFDDGSVPMDTCHAWMWYESAGYSPPWWEWADFWAPPLPGTPIIWVDGYTESPACDIPACDTTIETLMGGQFAYYYWKQPGNDEFLNMKFDMPADHSGRLETIAYGFYAAGTQGTPDPDFYVWFSDGTFPLDNNPPYQAIADFHLTFEELVYWPGFTELDVHGRNIIFDPGEMFHVGFSHAFEPGDTMAPLSDDGSMATQRSSGWYDGAWEDYWPYEFIIWAYICPFAPENPTFTMRCTPPLGFATPGDPPVDVYEVEIISVIGYAEIVDLSLIDVSPAPAGPITATFTPNSVPCPYTSDVAIQVDGAVAYGDYTLTFQGVGADAQTKTCNVTLTVQPPYDEGIVNFYHGYQRSTNFGAVGNGDLASQNFVWYGVAPLFDGSIISATPVDPYQDHIALDLYDCEHVGFVPTEHMVITSDPWCAGTAYEEYYGEVAYSHFYAEESIIPGEYDSVFIIGLSDVECTDFSIKIKIYYNPTGTASPEIYSGIFEDWDVGDDWGELDTVHNMMYQYDVADPQIVFGIMSVPFYDQFCHSMVSIYNVEEVYPTGSTSINCGVDPPAGPQYLANLMMTPGYRYPGFWGEGADDHSVLITSPPFVLNPGEKHIEIWIDFGRNLADGLTWEQWWHRILRYAGFYRGDVDASDTLELPTLDVSDLVYLINYLFKGGDAPIPFADQGDADGKGPYSVGPCDGLDVNCPKNNVDVQDLVYLLNYIYKGGPPPIDRVRFIEQCYTRPSLFLNPNW